jgi:hypothetical protein
MAKIKKAISNSVHTCLLLSLALLLSGCSTKEKKTKKTRRGEYIFRKQNEFFFTPPPSSPTIRKKYPWEDRYIGELPRITKDFFRCKGNPLNPPIIQIREGKESLKYFDCQGKHGLPLKDGKEFVYPCLLELLNAIQEKLGKKVIVTSGHRCPKHNLYVDHRPANWSSKHMLGAEVDFYVEGYEKNPLAIVAFIQKYYSEAYGQDKNYTSFQRYEKEGLNVLTPPWYNKEIFIKLYLENEGRNCDNQHPYPYLSIQVRYDSAQDSKVTFDQSQSQNYLRR